MRRLLLGALDVKLAAAGGERPRRGELAADFFEDTGKESELGVSATGGRLAPIVASLAWKEEAPGRRQRSMELANEMVEGPVGALAGSLPGC